MEVCKLTTKGHEQVEEGTTTSGKDVRTVGKSTGNAPDMQNVWDITETIMEERVVEEVPPNTWEQVPQCLSMERCKMTGELSKISGWPENIAIHHAKGCACCHEYINHLLRAQSLRQINLQHINVENAVQSTWLAFINSIEIEADQHIQGQLSNLHAQIDELVGLYRNVKII